MTGNSLAPHADHPVSAVAILTRAAKFWKRAILALDRLAGPGLRPWKLDGPLISLS